MIKTADWVIDLGPEGGDRGGRIIAEGTPEQITKVAESYTGQYLCKALAGGGYLRHDAAPEPGSNGKAPPEPVALPAAPRRRKPAAQRSAA